MKRQGYFSLAFIEGLSGGAAIEWGEVTLEGLIEYLGRKVPSDLRRDQGENAKQVPRVMLDGYSAKGLVLSVTAPKVVATTPVPAPTPTLDPEEEAWKVVAPSKNPEVVREFLRLHPNGRYMKAAQLKLKDL